jgi:hypothetical protein
MNPPYKFVDEADNKTVWTKDGQQVPEGTAGAVEWKGIDATPGGRVSIYDETGGWARVSPDSLIYPGGTPPDPNPDPNPNPEPEPNPTPGPIPSAGDSMDKPTNQTQLRDALETYRLEKRVGIFDPRTEIEITSTVQVGAAGASVPWGVNGNFAKIRYVGSGGHDMIVFRGTKGAADRCLVVEKLTLQGNGSASPRAGTCLRIYAPEGDPGSFYKFKIKDIYTDYATHGFKLEGAVFEGYLDNIHAENHSSHGMVCLHTHTPGEHQGIISNVNIVHPNLSRNTGAGLLCTYSTNVILGSFVLNALGGVLAPEGMRAAWGNNGENTGEALFVIPSNGYGTVLRDNEVSSDGSTHHRVFEGGQWVSKGQPCLYLLAGHANVIERDGHVSYYGSAGTDPMRVRK